MTTEGDEITTEEEATTTEDRSIGDLLDCKTYQGMTDTEIQSLIDYWRQYGYSEGYTACETAQTNATQSALIESANAAYDASQKAFDAAIQTQVNFLVYDGSV